jgi:pyruvate dehydrogenase E2 component (dihydrolipoamide acetyltransferase)
VPTDFLLPELGEGVTSADVLRVLVKVGDTIAKDQAVLELETDKATIEVPSAVAGPVTEVKVKPGDKVTVGQAILTVDAIAAIAPVATVSKGAAAKTASPAAPVAPVTNVSPEVEADSTADRPVEKPASRAADKVVDINRGARPASDHALAELPANAAPSVRRMARELGVDVNDVPGSGSDGRISAEDVKAHTKRLLASAAEARQTVGTVSPEPLPDFTRWGPVDRQPMRAVRRKTAEHLSVAWTTIPHVTQHEFADVTGLEELRPRYAKLVEAAGGHLTVTAVAVKVVATALRMFPQFNASIDVPAGEIVLKQYVNVGVAVDTDRGLLVPVIRDADTKNLLQIAIELTTLSEKARSRKIAIDEMQGGCFSISNLGGIGGAFFTPIINAPEVAILGISRARMQPVFNKATGQFEPRQMLPLSLSYDHRVVDGADGMRFLRWVAEAFEQPFVLALQG